MSASQKLTIASETNERIVLPLHTGLAEDFPCNFSHQDSQPLIAQESVGNHKRGIEETKDSSNQSEKLLKGSLEASETVAME